MLIKIIYFIKDTINPILDTYLFAPEDLPPAAPLLDEAPFKNSYVLH